MPLSCTCCGHWTVGAVLMGQWKSGGIGGLWYIAVKKIIFSISHVCSWHDALTNSVVLQYWFKPQHLDRGFIIAY